MDEVSLNEQQLKRIREISADFFQYAKGNLYIKNKDAEIVKFEPNIAQRALIERVIYLLEEGKPIRIIVLKARQMGLSTAIEALIYWYTTTHRNITAAIIAHEDAASRNLYNMFKRYYDNSNILFKPNRKYDTRSDLTFGLQDKDGNEIGLNSVIKTATAKNTGAGRSDTIQLVHGSEVAFWENGEELVGSLMQTVPSRKNTMIFLESTANGRGNFFAKMWDKSVKGDSVFETFFFPWWIQDEYEQDGDPIDSYTPDEQDVVDLMREGITIGNEHYKVPEDRIDAKIRFRRMKEREFVASPELLLQEYPSTPHEAFIASGSTVFNVKALAHMEKLVKDCPTYTIHDNGEREPYVVEDKHAKLKIWDMPEVGEEYVIGADAAEGLSDGDFSVADVIRVRDMKTVARFRSQLVDPDQFAHILDKLGRFYNYALIGPEINNHGLAVVQRLRDLFYSNLYKREKGLDEVFETSTTKFGWKTTTITKPLAIDYLAEAIREGLVKDEDIVFIEEAFSYVRDEKGRTNAEEGTHDDTVMAKAIALQLWDWSANNKKDLQVIKPTGKKKHKVIK